MRPNLNVTSAHILAKTPVVLTRSGLPHSFPTGMTGTLCKCTIPISRSRIGAFSRSKMLPTGKLVEEAFCVWNQGTNRSLCDEFYKYVI